MQVNRCSTLYLTYIDRVRLKQTNKKKFQAILPSIFYPLLTLPMTTLVTLLFDVKTTLTISPQHRKKRH